MDREAGAGGGASTAASVTVNKPAGTIAGDVMIAAVTADGGTGVTISAPTGWTAIRLSTNTTVIATRAFYKIATATEPANYAFTLSVAKKAAASISTYTGVATTGNPVNVDAISAGATSTAHTVGGHGLW